jgi:hypothetical protein
MLNSKQWGMFFLICWNSLLSVSLCFGQADFKIYLVGDAGDHTESGETLLNLRKQLLNNPNSAVVFMGDNSYKNDLWGIIHFGFKGFDSSRNTIEKVRSQLNLMDQYKGWVYFVPGNHDWWNRTTYQRGKGKLAMEESFIESNLKLNKTIANPDSTFLPVHGGYGPEYVELNNQTIRLVFFDSYRIIQTGIKKSKVPDEEKSFYSRLDSIIGDGYRKNEKILVISHHPVHLKGPYDRDLKHPYFFGRIKASNSNFPSYKKMIDSVQNVLSHYPGIYYASGHVHALQYFNTENGSHYLISGAGSKEIKLSPEKVAQYENSLGPGEFLLWNTGGFFELDFKKSGVNTFLYYNDGSLKCSFPK